MRETPVERIIDVEEAQPEVRRALRRALSMPCELVSHYWEGPVAHCIGDVSPFGAWIDTFFPLHPGAELVVSFSPPGASRELVLFGEVVRVVTGRLRNDRGPLGMGIGFVGVSADDQEALGDLLLGVPPRLPRASREPSPSFKNHGCFTGGLDARA